MSYQGAPQPLSTIQHNLPILGMPLPTRAPEYERDGHDIDLKGYFNILYPSPMMPTTALRASNLAIRRAR